MAWLLGFQDICGTGNSQQYQNVSGRPLHPLGCSYLRQRSVSRVHRASSVSQQYRISAVFLRCRPRPGCHPRGCCPYPIPHTCRKRVDAVWFDGLSAGTPFSIGAHAASTTKSIAPKKSVQPSAISFGASSTPNFAEASMERAMSVMPILWRLKPGCIGINAWKEIGELLLRIVRVMETLPSLGL